MKLMSQFTCSGQAAARTIGESGMIGNGIINTTGRKTETSAPKNVPNKRATPKGSSTCHLFGFASLTFYFSHLWCSMPAHRYRDLPSPNATPSSKHLPVQLLCDASTDFQVAKHEWCGSLYNQH